MHAAISGLVYDEARRNRDRDQEQSSAKSGPREVGLENSFQFERFESKEEAIYLIQRPEAEDLFTLPLCRLATRHTSWRLTWLNVSEVAQIQKG